MLKAIKQRFRDMKTLSLLISEADRQANGCGEEEAGAEHFVLSALLLPDGTAQKVFDRFDVDSIKFLDAIKQQYRDALHAVGVNSEIFDSDAEPIEPSNKLLKSKPSGQALVKSLYTLRKMDKHRPLMGAHVIAVIADLEHGVTARALQAIGVDREQLAMAAQNELDSYD